MRLVFLAFLCGCSLGGFAVPLSVEGLDTEDGELSQECVDLDNAYMAVTAVGTAMSGVSAASNMALAVWPDPTRDELIGIGLTGLGTGVVGATLGVVGSMLAQRFVERCAGGN